MEQDFHWVAENSLGVQTIKNLCCDQNYHIKPPLAATKSPDEKVDSLMDFQWGGANWYDYYQLVVHTPAIMTWLFCLN
jgi:hypothetical protein